MANEFYFCICSPFGPTYQFDLRGTTAYYSFSTQHLVVERDRLPPLEYQPSEEAIKRFWEAVVQIGVLDWQPEYSNEQIPSGPKWRLQLLYSGSEQVSRGQSAFPNSPNPTYSPEFIQLISTVRSLLEWMPFG